MPAANPDDIVRQVEEAMSARFAEPPARASVSFVGVEPITVLRFSDLISGTVSLLTSGMSRRPMADSSAVSTTDGPRAELIAQVSDGREHGGPSGGGDLWKRLAVLAAAPVVEGVVYVDGMTVDLGIPLDGSSRCTGGLIVAAELPPVETAAGEVAILRFVPATSTELAYSRVHGSSVLVARWQSAGTDLLDLSRSPVDLA